MGTLPAKVKNAQALIQGMEGRIKAVLPKHLTPERAMRVMCNMISRNPKLANCTQVSLCEAVMTASEFGLEPNTPLGLCYIIPYKDQAVFQPGYKGLVKLAYNSGQIKQIYVEAVRANDEFRITRGLSRDIHHLDAAGDRGEVVGYYAVVQTKDGGNFWHHMTKGECMAHGRKYSKAFNKADSPWQKDPDPMCRKTVLIQALKLAPKSIDDLLERAMFSEGDSTVVDRDDAIDIHVPPPKSLDDVAETLEQDGQPDEPDAEYVDPGTGEVLNEAEAEPEPATTSSGDLF